MDATKTVDIYRADGSETKAALKAQKVADNALHPLAKSLLRKGFNEDQVLFLIMSSLGRWKL
jgi:hypothetical protein